MRALITDALGSTVALSDSAGAGAVLTEYSYQPFGAVAVSGVGTANPFQYTGRENDETGLYFYRARHYSPARGRFIIRDPRDFAAGDINLYAYGRNSPLNFDTRVAKHGLLSEAPSAGRWPDATGTIGIDGSIHACGAPPGR